MRPANPNTGAPDGPPLHPGGVALIIAVGVVFFGSIGAFLAYAVSPIGSLSLAQSYALVISTIVALGMLVVWRKYQRLRRGLKGQFAAIRDISAAVDLLPIDEAREHALKSPHLTLAAPARAEEVSDAVPDTVRAVFMRSARIELLVDDRPMLVVDRELLEAVGGDSGAFVIGAFGPAQRLKVVMNGATQRVSLHTTPLTPGEVEKSQASPGGFELSVWHLLLKHAGIVAVALEARSPARRG